MSASAYINSAVATPAASGTTTLYGIDETLDVLVTQNPPNAGVLNTVGDLNFNPIASVSFDIFTDPLSFRRFDCRRHRLRNL